MDRAMTLRAESPPSTIQTSWGRLANRRLDGNRSIGQEAHRSRVKLYQ